MKMRANNKLPEKVEVPMTPMIDIVFQLLVFFIMTFKISSPEGDFNIKMPLAAPSEGNPEDELLPPIKIRLTYVGNQLGVKLADRPMGSVDELKAAVMELCNVQANAPVKKSDFEVELDCDYNLPYTYVVDTLSKVTGFVRNGKVEKLIEKVKFAPPRNGPPS